MYVEVRISRSISESLGLRDNESRLYIEFYIFVPSMNINFHVKMQTLLCKSQSLKLRSTLRKMVKLALMRESVKMFILYKCIYKYKPTQTERLSGAIKRIINNGQYNVQNLFQNKMGRFKRRSTLEHAQTAQNETNFYRIR